LREKVVEWGLKKCLANGFTLPTSPKIKKLLFTGRVWVAIVDPSNPQCSQSIAAWLKALNSLKGAYQERVEGSGIYFQPKPEFNGGLQHRLKKEKGLWIIEEQNPLTVAWKPRAKQDNGNMWVDLKNDVEPFRLKVIPLSDILKRMTDVKDNEIEKNLDFLFQKCNQLKIHTKLKDRNLLYNIKTYQALLTKQNCLIFAVHMAEVADAIAKNCDYR
jgi:hypothetical protein